MYEVHVLVQGYPGRAVCHGGLGWSTVTLIRGQGRQILVDVGGYATRKEIAKQLTLLSVNPSEISDVVLTHAHHDHAVNFTLFPEATIWIGKQELLWAAAQKPGFNPIAELHVRELMVSERVRRLEAGSKFLECFTAHAVPGHTPGHLAYYFSGNDAHVLFTGDAAKNRAELKSRTVDMTYNEVESASSIEEIWRLWKERKSTILIPGHDLSMCLDADGEPYYLGERKAGIEAWFSESLEHTTLFDLCRPSPFGMGYEAKL